MKRLLFLLFFVPVLCLAQKNRTYVRLVACAASTPGLRMAVDGQMSVRQNGAHDFFTWGTVLPQPQTGIQSPACDALTPVNGLLHIYTLDGRLYRTVKTSEALARLPKGVYIVNGKKHVVR